MFINLDIFLKNYFKKNIEQAQAKKYQYISKFCENINKQYLKDLTLDKNNKFLLYSINDKLSENYKNEIIGVVIYRTILYNHNKIRIYIQVISVHKKMRAFGYGSLIIDEFMTRFNKNKTIEFVLLSLNTSYEFYKKLGFEKADIKYIQKKEVLDDNIMMIKIV